MATIHSVREHSAQRRRMPALLLGIEGMKAGRILLRLVLYAILVAGSIAMVFPFLWGLSSSFKNTGEIFSYPPDLIPKVFRFENYQQLLAGSDTYGQTSFVSWFFNSAFIAMTRVLLVLFFSSLAGYAFAKYEFRFRRPLFLVLLASMMLPFQVQIIPLFVIMSKLHWTDSYAALIVPFAADAFGTFLMRQYMVSAVPEELVDAARLDGASEFGIYARIALPLSRAALATLAVVAFMNAWNAFMWPLIVLRSAEKYTLPLGMANLLGTSGQGEQLWGYVMAGAVLATLPLLVLYVLGQKQFISGLTVGAVRG
jgi:ABC-type glycerol-3-phosphate transport system permease component